MKRTKAPSAPTRTSTRVASGRSIVGAASLYRRIRTILEQAQDTVARTVNTAHVTANWLIGREIVEAQQRGRARADYGIALLKELSRRMGTALGRGYSVDTLEACRRFYLTYADLISDTASRKSPALRKSDTASRKSLPVASPAPATAEGAWVPGRLHPHLAWSLYRQLLKVSSTEARSFYEIEAVANRWTARELERQINSLLFERLAKSRDRKGVLALATHGHQIQTPADVFKDPVVMEFLGLPEHHRLIEGELESALLSNLQQFLLEMGKGFAFVARQERLTLEGDHFYVDLVFYHTVIKCYVLIDLKVGKLTHQDLGQLQLYVNYYDRERCTPGDQPTLGLILCTDKNDTAVKYTLGTGQKTIFASRYQLHVPSEADLTAELRREVALLSPLGVKVPRAPRRRAAGKGLTK